MSHALGWLYACKLTFAPTSLYTHSSFTESFPPEKKLEQAAPLPGYGGKFRQASSFIPLLTTLKRLSRPSPRNSAAPLPSIPVSNLRCADTPPAPDSDTSRKTDLVTNILGIQVDARASTIEWASGQHTVLPFLPKHNRNRHVLNLLANDARYAADLAKLPQAGASSSLVVYLDNTMPKTKLFTAAREAMSLNKTVVIPGYVDTDSFDFSLEDLQEHLSISPHQPIEAHGTSLFSIPSPL